MKWITREKVKVDRVACPWLIKRFIDRDAEFVFLEYWHASSETVHSRTLDWMQSKFMTARRSSA